MQTLTSDDTDYIAASFKAWCRENHKPAPAVEDALAYLTYVQDNAPFIAELIDDD